MNTWITRIVALRSFIAAAALVQALVGSGATGTSPVGLMNSGLNRTSLDGITWTDQARGSTNLLYGVASGPGSQLVAVGAYGLAFTSP